MKLYEHPWQSGTCRADSEPLAHLTPGSNHHHGRLAVRTPSITLWSYTDSIRRWYKGITPKTRIFIGVGIMAYAGVGLFLSDKAEEKFGLVPTEKDKEELRKAIPTITVVEKGDR